MKVNNNPWSNKMENCKNAVDHINMINSHYKKETELCVKKTKEYKNSELCKLTMYSRFHFQDNCDIEVVNADTVTALLDAPKDKKIAVLNFASYKQPGGMFKNGSMAQEEALCHESNLFNVLSSFEKTFYAENKKRLNHALYNSNLLYSKDILFIRDKTIRNADVITCAAPNRGAAKKYGNISDEDCSKALIQRIETVIMSAIVNEADILILGAFGCGVFKNNPNEVATFFKVFLESEFKYGRSFKKVIFAIPKGNQNYEVFRKILC